jgi:hypothetical protein
MPKPTLLNDIFELLLVEEAPTSPHHFLFLMGTDVDFIKGQIPHKDYPRGETLSYAAQAIVALLGETGVETPVLNGTGPAEKALSYSSPSVDVLDGPRTLGKEVGERIAQGIFLALRAAASSKTTLELIAFSRGSAEAILLMHELDRITDALKKEPLKSLRTILLETPCDLTKVALEKYFPSSIGPSPGENTESRAKLHARLAAVKVNAFLIDPVPGDSLYFDTWFEVPRIAWRDRRFHTKPKCMSSYELILKRDERTACFRPILPREMTATILPGHHGTACGNALTQALTRLPDELSGLDTTGVQDLILLKLFHFLHQATGAFGATEHALELHHPILDALLSRYLRSHTEAKRQMLIEIYNRIYANDAAYKHFSLTAYPLLGRDPALDGHRHVRTDSGKSVSMSTLLSPTSGPIVNLEHANLLLANYIDFSLMQETDPSKQAEGVALVLEKMINLSAEFFPVTATPATRALLINGLATLVDSISQKYLRNHLSVEKKLELKATIINTFSRLAAAIEEPTLAIHKIVFEECQAILQDSVKATIEKHYHSILQQYAKIHHQIELFIAPNTEFTSLFTAFLSTLTLAEDPTGLCAGIKTRLSAITPITLQNVQRAITTELDTISQNETLTQEQKAQLIVWLTNHSLALREFFEAYQDSVEQYLVRMNELHDATLELCSISPQFAPLLGTKDLHIDVTKLLFYSRGLTNLAGLMLKEKSYDLRTTPDAVRLDFYTLAKQQAIALGAPSPDIEALTARVISQETITLNHQATIRGLQEAIAAHETTIADLQQAVSGNETSIRTLQGIIDEDKVTISGLQERLAEYTRTIETLERTHAEKRHEQETTTESKIQQLTAAQQQLLSKSEIDCGFLIHHKLLPLTITYLHRILASAAQYVVIKDRNDSSQDLPSTVTHLSPGEQHAYEKIKLKFERAKHLHSVLTNTEMVLPSQRLATFKTQLETYQGELKQHMDPDWKVYFKSCMAILGILLTGIVPVVLGLIAYSQATGRSPLFFAQSVGERYLEDAAGMVNPHKVGI